MSRARSAEVLREEHPPTPRLTPALRPHLHTTYPLEEAARALRDLAERRVMGKAALPPRRRSTS